MSKNSLQTLKPIGFSPILIAILVAALLTGPLLLWYSISGEALEPLMPVLIFMIALEASLTSRWLEKAQRYVHRVAYRLAEVILLILLMRLLSWELFGPRLNLTQIRLYLVDPAALLDLPFVFMIIVMLLAWTRSIIWSQMLAKLSIGVKEVRHYQQVAKGYQPDSYDSVPRTNRRLLLNGLIRDWLFWGLFLVFTLSLSTIEFAEVFQNQSGMNSLRTIGRLGLPPVGLLALLTYFLLGLGLIGRGRLIVLQAQWYAQNYETNEDMLKRWNRTSFWVLAAVATLAAFIPIGSTVMISKFLQLIIWIIVGAVTIFAGVIGAIVIRILSLFLGSEQLPPSENQALSEVIPEIDQSQLSLELPPYLLEGMFWIATIIAISAAILIYLRHRNFSVEFVFIPKLWFRLADWLQQLISRLTRQSVQVTSSVSQRLRRLSKGRHRPRVRLRLPGRGPQSPRDQVRYYYLSTVDEAIKGGTTRSDNTTPSEFAADLLEDWSEESADIAYLTSAFIKARYSNHEIRSVEVPPVRQIWQRLATAFSRKKD